MRYLVTGGAGFIGSHLCDALLARGDEVLCLDNFNDYYSPARKRANIAAARHHSRFTLAEVDFRDLGALEELFARHRPEKVAHLGAMAGPRPSMANPALYEDVNVRGTMNVLTIAGRAGVKGLVLASTSSVYGMSPTPWREDSPTDRPLSYYAATKKAAEVLAYTAHNQYGTPTRVVRFFTVYGPRGRPDMTPMLFVEPMRQGRPVTLFNGGVGVYRDWTYVDDIIAGVLAALDADLPYDIFNLGNSQPVQLIDFIAALERTTGLRATIEARPLPPADPPLTYADVSKARSVLGFEPRTTVEQGLARFWEWYQREAPAG
ncbi:MAG TPA: NAD-dependent epimerase/dehydratase family protein [Roseiflexaceae bacterium]|nr:NAD-dependent epimerase/dehydratase family protein [Roseiflexaceae bacterium]